MCTFIWSLYLPMKIFFMAVTFLASNFCFLQKGKIYLLEHKYTANMWFCGITRSSLMAHYWQLGMNEWADSCAVCAIVCFGVCAYCVFLMEFSSDEYVHMCVHMIHMFHQISWIRGAVYCRNTILERKKIKHSNCLNLYHGPLLCAHPSYV